MAVNGDLKSDFQATHDEGTFSQPSAGSSPFNSFIVEYDVLDTVNLLHPRSSKEANNRVKELASSGELGDLSRHNNPPPGSFIGSVGEYSRMQPPPAQFMGSVGEYDPYRIPGSAFSTKCGTHVEWSAASNESLFSIQMGNASFNRDHPAFFHKSQELTKFDDMMNLSSGLPQVSADRDNTNIHSKQDLVVLRGALEDQKKESSDAPLAVGTWRTPRSSNGSNSRVQPFSFPILDNADIRNSLGKLGPAEMNTHKSHLETPKAAQGNEEVMNSPVAKNTNWFSFPCWRR